MLNILPLTGRNTAFAYPAPPREGEGNLEEEETDIRDKYTTKGRKLDLEGGGGPKIVY